MVSVIFLCKHNNLNIEQALTPHKRQELTEEVKKRNYYESLELEKQHIEKKNNIRNFNRCLNIQRRELEHEENERQKKETAFISAANLKQDEKIAQELHKMKNKELRELRLR